jgi:hypothetical protein
MPVKKTIISATFAVLCCLTVQAKKVKFSVDFGTDSVSTSGVHVIGSFETALGLPANFDADSTTNITKLYQEGTSSIYSTVLDIPAFSEYQYIFINGIGYSDELPPLESQVQYGFKVNRFFFLDSIANDTTDLGAVRFGMNAPKGKKLLRFKVDMQQQTVSTNGVYVNGGMQGSAKKMYRMCPLGNVYHYITYIDSGSITSYEYDFVNGNAITNKEVKDATCTNSNASRISIDSVDRELDTVCYASCKACAPLGFPTLNPSQENFISTNTIGQGFTLFIDNGKYDATIYNSFGQKIKVISNINTATTNIENMKSKGVYWLQLKNKQTGKVQNIKFLQQ